MNWTSRRPLGYGDSREDPDAEAFWLGLVSLVLGVLAVALMVIPPAVIGEPLGFLKRENEPVEAPKVSETQTSVSVGKFSFSWRKQHKPEPAVAPDPAQAEPPVIDWVRISTVGGLSTALLGLLVSPIAFTRRRDRSLALSGAVLCCAALTWQYIMIGLAIGAAIAILLLLLSSFST